MRLIRRSQNGRESTGQIKTSGVLHRGPERSNFVGFDGIAANSLLHLTKMNPKAMELASKNIEQRRRLAGQILRGQDQGAGQRAVERR